MKILLVEDSTIVRKFMINQFEKSQFELLVAKDYKEAKVKTRLHKKKIKVVLADLNLPDAPHGEVVDFLLEQGMKVVVFTANMSEDTYYEMMQKNIVSYILKDSKESLVYAANLIKQIATNDKYPILIVDDSSVARKKMRQALGKYNYTLFEASNGLEALEVMNKEREIKLIITDHEMPMLNGLGLVKNIRKLNPRDELAILVITSADDSFLTIEYLKYGANDILKKPFVDEEVVYKTALQIEMLEYIRNSREAVDRDYMSGAYNRHYFFNEAKNYYEKTLVDKESFILSMIDIDNLKEVNDKYGQDAGDAVIKKAAKILQDNVKGSDVVARFTGGEFGVLIKDINVDSAEATVEKLRYKVEEGRVEIGSEDIIKFTVSIGMTMDLADSFDEMLNEADTLLYRAKQNGRNRVEVND